MTALDLCKSALRLLGVHDPDEELTAAEAQIALEGLNDIIGGLSLELGMLPRVNHVTVTTVAGKTVYTIGDTGDWVLPRPVKVADLTREAYQGMPATPVSFSADTDFPLITVALGYLPSGESLELYFWTPLTKVADLTTEIVFPPGYEQAFKFALAIRLAPDMQTSASGEVVTLARRYIANVKAINAPKPKMTLRHGLSAISK